MIGKTGTRNESPGRSGYLNMERSDEGVFLNLAGDWIVGSRIPSATEVEDGFGKEPLPGWVAFKSERLERWDSVLLAFLVDVSGLCREKGIPIITEGLPGGVQRLLRLALAVPAKAVHKEAARPGFLARVGERSLAAGDSVLDALAFVGEVASGFARLLAGEVHFRPKDLWLILRESGSRALPIVSLISLLVGLILAFVGAIQLRLFGAQIYVADLVGIAMVRAMGAIMTGIIMAGRTGASFAAQIGTMQVNEEIDALKTAGIPPVDFLVVPRVLALTIMLPLLTLYADFMGILGGLFVAVSGLNLSPTEFYTELRRAVPLTHLWIGIFSGFVFGILVSLTGCLKGMQCGRSASAVGDATRSAVVAGIVGIVAATAIITIVCDILGI